MHLTSLLPSAAQQNFPRWGKCSLSAPSNVATTRHTGTNGASVAEKLNSKLHVIVIDLDVNRAYGCWLPPWPAQQSEVLSGSLEMPSSPASWGPTTCHGKAFPACPFLWDSHLRGIWFFTELSSKCRPTIPRYLSGFKMSCTNNLQKVHISKNARDCMEADFQIKRQFQRPDADEHVCQIQNRTNRALSRLLSIPATWKGESAVRKTGISGTRPSE